MFQRQTLSSQAVDMVEEGENIVVAINEVVIAAGQNNSQITQVAWETLNTVASRQVSGETKSKPD